MTGDDDNGADQSDDEASERSAGTEPPEGSAGEETPYRGTDESDRSVPADPVGGAGDGSEGEGWPMAGDGPDDAGGGQAAADEDVPLSGIADRLDQRDAPADEAFEAFDVVSKDGLDGDALWEDLAGPLSPPGEPEPAADEAVHELPEKEYCRRCQYFSAPPEVSCGYEGSEILAVVDTETFRVRGCPVVRGDEPLRERE